MADDADLPTVDEILHSTLMELNAVRGKLRKAASICSSTGGPWARRPPLRRVRRGRHARRARRRQGGDRPRHRRSTRRRTPTNRRGHECDRGNRAPTVTAGRAGP